MHNFQKQKCVNLHQRVEGSSYGKHADGRRKEEASVGDKGQFFVKKLIMSNSPGQKVTGK